MLEELLPKAHGRYSSLPLLGTMADGFAQWLVDQGYPHSTVTGRIRCLPSVDGYLRSQGFESLSAVDGSVMERCRTEFRWRDGNFPPTAGCLGKYLEAKRPRREKQLEPLKPSEKLVVAYGESLRRCRGVSQSTIRNHLRTAGQFLAHLGNDDSPSLLAALGPSGIEAFVAAKAREFKRSSLQQAVAHLRGFLQFLAARGEVAFGLDKMIDTPRVYREEQLPRSLPWETVCTLLRGISRTTRVGLRDHAMLFLLATYGLRVCEVAALRLDDINWRNGYFRVPRRKVQHPLILPLTDGAASTLVCYLRDGRDMHAPFREVFLRRNAPPGPLGATGVSMVFARCAKRSGLPIPYSGAHCLRHSYAVHLLRSGTSLKTIGDLLGHCNAESTHVYLRLATEDLRGVALSLPSACSSAAKEETKP